MLNSFKKRSLMKEYNDILSKSFNSEKKINGFLEIGINHLKEVF